MFTNLLLKIRINMNFWCVKHSMEQRYATVAAKRQWSPLLKSLNQVPDEIVKPNRCAGTEICARHTLFPVGFANGYEWKSCWKCQRHSMFGNRSIQVLTELGGFYESWYIVHEGAGTLFMMRMVMIEENGCTVVHQVRLYWKTIFLSCHKVKCREVQKNI